MVVERARGLRPVAAACRRATGRALVAILAGLAGPAALIAAAALPSGAGAQPAAAAYGPAAHSTAPPVATWLRASQLPPDDVGIVAVPVAGGPPLVSLNAERAFNPASTMKLVTSYAGLALLGPEYRWRTTLHTAGRLAGDVLSGDLILRGSGDPKLVIEDLTGIVQRLRAAGVREIRGDLVLDDALYEVGEESAERAFDGDPSQPYNVRPFAALLNFKATRFVLRPEPGAVAITLDPPLADVEIVNEVRLVRGPCRPGLNAIGVRDGPGERAQVRVAGSLVASCGEQSVFAAVLGHRQFAHGLFKAAWLAAGGVWNGATRVERGAASRAAPLLEWVSPRTLADVVRDINKFSNNVMARQLLLQIPADLTRTPATLERARRMVRTWLDGQGLEFPELVIDNGSGLSRIERISAANLARLLAHAAAGPLGDVFRESLPVVGADGTMARRLGQDPIRGNAWIKTGSLNEVRTIAGYVDAMSGRRYVVVMLVNGPRAAASQPAQDALLRWVHANG